MNLYEDINDTFVRTHLDKYNDMNPPPAKESCTYYQFVMDSYEDLNGNIIATHLEKYNNPYCHSHSQEDMVKESAWMDSQSEDSSRIIVIDLKEYDDIYPPTHNQEMFDKQPAGTECEGFKRNFVATHTGKCNDVYPPPHAKTNIVYQMYRSPSESTNSTNPQVSADFSVTADRSNTSSHKTEILVDSSTWDSSTVASSQNINSTTANHYQDVARSVANSKYKTAICRWWMMKGNCQYGTNCAFAHGESELRGIYQPETLINLTPGKDPNVIAIAPLKKAQTVKGRGVVCTVEEHQCFVYSYDFLVEPYLLFKDNQIHLRLGQWIDFTAKEDLSGIFEIVDYITIEPPFDTLRCKHTVMVRCFVEVPADIMSNSEQPMNSSISRRVLCKDTSVIEGYEGQEVRAILRYSYDESEVCGYWNLECVGTE